MATNISHKEPQETVMDQDVGEQPLQAHTNDDQKEIRLVLVGLTGSGKSASGNTILGLSMEKPFKSSSDPSSTTKRCTLKEADVLGRKLAVIDTPGFFDTAKPSEATKKEVMRCISLSSPGPHALLLVLKMGTRFTKEVCSVVDIMKGAFGPQCVKYIVFLFTAGDTLERDGMDAEEYVDGFEGVFQELFEECDRRYVVFDNTMRPPTSEDNVSQITKLLETVEEMMEQNGGHYDVKILEEMMLRQENAGKERATGARGLEKSKDKLCVAGVENDKQTGVDKDITTKKLKIDDLQMSESDAAKYLETMNQAQQVIRQKDAEIENLKSQLKQYNQYKPSAQHSYANDQFGGACQMPKSTPHAAADGNQIMRSKDAEIAALRGQINQMQQQFYHMRSTCNIL